MRQFRLRRILRGAIVPIPDDDFERSIKQVLQRNRFGVFCTTCRWKRNLNKERGTQIILLNLFPISRLNVHVVCRHLYSRFYCASRGARGRSLRERAVAIVEGTPPLWSVVAANRRAAQTGIALGMAKSQAEQFTGVEIRHRSPAQEKTTHEALLDLGWSVSPRVEDSAPDTIVLDLAGLSGLFGAEEKIAEELAKRGAGLGLSASVAVAENIEVAILAARGFPGVTLIPPGEEANG